MANSTRSLSKAILMTAYAQLEAVLLALGCASSDVINASCGDVRQSNAKLFGTQRPPASPSAHLLKQEVISAVFLSSISRGFCCSTLTLLRAKNTIEFYTACGRDVMSTPSDSFFPSLFYSLRCHFLRAWFLRANLAVNAFSTRRLSSCTDDYAHAQWLKCKIRGGETLHSGLGP